MTLEALFTLSLVFTILASLIFTRIGADIIFMGALTLLLVTQILTPQEALAGFSNPGMITVGVLYVVVAGLQRTGGIHSLAQFLLGQPKGLLGAQVRVMLPVTVMSAFLNNTPVVAMLIPAVNDWAKRYSLPVSKLMIPLSYAAIFGGTTTLIGTSTNLVVNGLLLAHTDLPSLGFFEIAWVGVPSALLGVTFVLCFSRWLLPDRRPVLGLSRDPREYTVEMLVDETGPLAGKTVGEAGLRHLPSMYLAEIERKGQLIPLVSPQERLQGGDQLIFVGIVESVVELQRIRGLVPATNQVFKLETPRSERIFTEVVVSNSCPLVGRTVREGNFRTVYNAVVVAAARNGQRIRKKLGDVVLQPGDTLLLEARPNFATQQRNSRDFYLVNPLPDSNPPNHERAALAFAILFVMITVVTLGFLDILQAALLAAGLMVATRCCTGTEARRSVDWRVLLVIAASFAVGRALEVTGSAAAVAGTLLSFADGDPWLSLALVYAVTTLFTELITNNAAAVLVFPIALALAQSLDVNFVPFAIAIMMAASASFSTPIGYQTNLMVYGPGGYHFSDYLRIGVPLNLLVGVVAVLLIPSIWPF